MRIASPGSAGRMAQVIVSEALGIQLAGMINRDQAMQVPAVAAARWLITTALARQPLTAWHTDQRISTPRWLVSTSGADIPQFRLIWTLDDLLFYGYSLWLVDRWPGGAVRTVAYLPFSLWEWEAEPATGDPLGTIVAREAPSAPPRRLDQSEFILFQSPMDPLLTIGRNTVIAALEMERAWRERVANPIPQTVLKLTEDAEVSPEELDDLVESWREARSKNQAVSGVPYGIDVQALGEVKPELFVEGRNAVTLDVARLTGLPASLLSASQVAASLTYSSREGSRNELFDLSLQPWALAIESRLSMDDLVEPGISIKFDLTVLQTALVSPTGPTLED